MSKKKAPAVKKPSNAKIWYIVGGIVLIVALLAIFWPEADNTPEVAEQTLPLTVTVQDAYQLRQEGAFILDVRQPDEWEQGRIPGATLIPLGELEARLDEVPQDKQVVVVCRSGNRSAEGRDILLAAGFTQVTSMDGGMNSWQAMGYETVTGQ
jgi:rhodanese-related sulfurtransferase